MGCQLHWKKALLVAGWAASMVSCSGQLRVDEADLSAIEQCLQTQETQQLVQEQQQRQILETLGLVRDMLNLQQQSLALHQFNLTQAPETESECPPVPEVEPETRAIMEKQVVGEVENVLLTGLDMILPARVDTGAVTASLDARDIQVFERNSEDWVRFTIINPETDEPRELERQRVRGVRIYQAGSEEPDRRPVVELRITLGEITQVAEFTLSDRSHLEYPMLIGRNILRDVMVVDISQSNIATPVVPEQPAVNGRAAE